MEFNSPRNFKNGKYIMNRYRIKDLIILVGGVVVSAVLISLYVNLMQSFNLIILVLLFIPALISILLTFSTPIYHNFYEFIKLFLRSKLNQRNFKWEGYHDGV